MATRKAYRPRKKIKAPVGEPIPVGLSEAEMYKMICSDKFSALETSIGKVETSQGSISTEVHDINVKVNDGFGKDIEYLRNSFKHTNRILLFILFVGFIGVAGMIYSSFQLVQSNTKNMMEMHKKIDNIQTSVNIHSLVDHQVGTSIQDKPIEID